MIFIVRHGQTEMNVRHVLQGRSNYPLNETGRAQAREAERRFREAGVRFDRVFASPLVRAYETAEILAGGATIETDDRLMEFDGGKYEGTDLSDPPEEVRRFFADLAHAPAPETMEPLPSVVARLGSFLEDRVRPVRDGNVLIATHAIAMKGALEYLTPGSDGSWWGRHIPNCGICRFSVSEFGFTVPVLIGQDEPLMPFGETRK